MKRYATSRYATSILGAALLLLAGCASVSPTPPATPAPAADATAPAPAFPAEVTVTPDLAAQTSPVPGGEGATASDIPPPPEPAPLPPASGNRAVIALLDRAQLAADAGRADTAAATLERALRIEPRNARLWHELAQLRLTQGQYAQAIALAQKSNSFAGTQRRLQALNWRVIGQARLAQGQAEAAQKALSLANELEQ